MIHEIAEQSTGCRGAGGYHDFAVQNGYNQVEVLNWTSSAGDWEFLISKDGQEWRILSQTNNWPRLGFSYEISEEVYHGTFAEVCELLDC